MENRFCDSDYANGGILELSERVKREIAERELEAVILKLPHNKDYLSFYKQIQERLEHEM